MTKLSAPRSKSIEIFENFNRSKRVHSVTWDTAAGVPKIKSFLHKVDAEAHAQLLREAAIVAQSAHYSLLTLVERYLAALSLKPGTRATYAAVVKDRMKPILGGVSLRQVDAAFINDYQSKLDSLNCYKSQKVCAWRLFNGALLLAKEDGLLSLDLEWSRRRPVLAVTPGRRSWEIHKARPVMPSLTAMKIMLKKSEGIMHIALLLAIRCGLRIGEILALEWSDVNFGTGYIHVKASVSDVTYIPLPQQREAGKFVQPHFPAGQHDSNKDQRDVPKTPSSVRSVLMSAKVAETLRAWKPATASMQDRVVCGPSTPQLSRSTIYPRFRKLQVTWGVAEAVYGPYGGITKIVGGFSLHQLRHGCAAMWIWQGISKEEISRMLGHANVQTTMDMYGYLLELYESNAKTWQGEGASPTLDQSANNDQANVNLYQRDGRNYREKHSVVPRLM